MTAFLKAHACGNDFLIVDGGPTEEGAQKEFALHCCRRTTGVGADGVEYLQWTGPRIGRIRLFNADGSIAEISGNGTRCVAAYMAWKAGAEVDAIFSIETDAGRRDCRIIEVSGANFQIATDMAVPEVTEKELTLADGTMVNGAIVSLGNPHFVLFADGEDFGVAGVPWEVMGREICFHPDFPLQTNVEFVRVVGRGLIEFRIFERGVGPTSSSGTGTCAAAAASIALRGVDTKLEVAALGGTQQIEWPDEQASMVLTGPAELIAAGEVFS